MNKIYTSLDLEEEYSLVSKFIAKKGYYKSYPSQYFEEISPLIEKLYSAYQFTPNTDVLSHPLIEKALELATTAHEGQERKYTHSPYLIHLIEVASNLSTVPNITHHEIVAALLHDVVEKGAIDIETLKTDFGQTVYEHMQYLTDHNKEPELNRKQRTAINFEAFKNSPPATTNIKVADILSNTKSILACDPNFNVPYMEDMIYMNDYFQNNPHVDQRLKTNFQNLMDISVDIMAVQKKHNIVKLDKKASKQIAPPVQKNSVKKLHF